MPLLTLNYHCIAPLCDQGIDRHQGISFIHRGEDVKNLSYFEPPASASFAGRSLPAVRPAAPRPPNSSVAVRAWRKYPWRAPLPRRVRSREVRPVGPTSTAADGESGTSCPDFAALPGTRRSHGHSSTCAGSPRIPPTERDTVALDARRQPSPL